MTCRNSPANARTSQRRRGDAGPVIGKEIIRLPSVASTMDEIARMASLGAAEGLVVVADEQTAGRGRGGRPWHAPPGAGLLFSVLLRPYVPAGRLSTLSLVAGVAVAEAMEQLGLCPRLKWPNDVWLDGKKVAGVLVQSRVGPAGLTAILGIGINVNVDPKLLPPGATSISEAIGGTMPRDDLLHALLRRLDAAYLAFGSDRGRPDLTGWTQRAALLGEQARVVDGSTVHTGEMRGIDDDGALLLQEADGRTIRIVAGDLTRGPRPTELID